MPRQSAPSTTQSACSGLIATACALLLGALLVQVLPTLPPTWLDAFAAALAAVALWRWPRLRWFALLLLGFAWTAWRADLALQARLPHALEGRDFDVIGVVAELPREREHATSFTLDIASATLDRKPVDVAGLTRLSWYGSAPSSITPCSRWQLRVRLKRPRGLLNPGGFDSERHALEQRIVAVGYVREQGEHQMLGAQAWCVNRMRADISAAIGAAIDNPHDARLVQALAVGDTQALDDHDWDVARVNGVSHLLAISGFHVGVAALFGVWLIQGLWWLWPRLGLRLPRPVAQAGAALLVASAYGALAGFGLPTQRTLLMIAVVSLACASRRAIGGAQALALALAVILVWDPLAVLSVGFWLSFAGVAFLMLGLSRPQGIMAHVRALGSAQLLMTVALLPLSVWFFGQASLIGALSNLIAVPAVSLLAVPLSLFGTLVWLLWPPAAMWFWQGAAWVMHGLWLLLEYLANWPGAHWYLPQLGAWAFPLALLGAVLVFLPRGVPGRWLGALLFLPLLFPRVQLPPEGAFRAMAFDVGQGLSVLVRTRHHALLYDAGARYPSGFDLGRAAVLPALRALGVRELDTLLISHGDNDHAGGGPAVANAYPHARLLGSEPERSHLPLGLCRRGQHWRWDGVEFRILHPRDGWENGSNNGSCVLLVSGAGGRLLLPGDIEALVEPEVAAGLHAGTPLVLIAAHHGSDTSSSAAFLAAADPMLAVVSAGYRSRYGHPSPEVLSRFRVAEIPWLNTADSGAISLHFPATEPPLVLRRERIAQDRYWRE